MRTSTAFVATAFGALAQAQSSSSQSVATASAVSTAPLSTPTLDPTQQAIYDCLDNCIDGDVSCTSQCIAVPNPNSDQVEATNDCVAACPQGNGTAAESAAYSTCVQNCISDNYFTVSGTPAASGDVSDSDSNEDGSSASGSAATGTGSSSGSDATASGASASDTGSASSAAPVSFQLSAASFGLLGFLAAVLVL